MTNLETEIARFRERYGVLEPEDLRNAIATSRLPGHPAWEEMIDWQNCLDDHRQIRNLLKDTSDAYSQQLSTST